MEEKFGAVIAAAGSSSRMGGQKSKVFSSLAGRQVLAYSLEVLDACPLVGEICLVCREEDMEEACRAAQGLSKPVQVVPGALPGRNLY